MTPAQERELRRRMHDVLLTYHSWETLIGPRAYALSWLDNNTEWLTPESAAYLLEACRWWKESGGFKAATYAKIEAIIKENIR